MRLLSNSAIFAPKRSLILGWPVWPLFNVLENDPQNKQLYQRYRHVPALKPSERRLVLLVHFRQRIEFCQDFEIRTFHNLQVAIPTAVWAYQVYPLRGIDGLSLMKWIFFSFLMSKGAAVASDCALTEQGKIYWLNMMRYALDMGFKSYYVYEDQNLAVELGSSIDYKYLETFFWGESKDYESSRILISKENVFPLAMSVEDFLTFKNS